MSHDRTLQLQDQLEIVLEQYEKEFAKLGNIRTQEELQPLFDINEQLRTILQEVKTYFIEVRGNLEKVPGIPPAKELAQLVIGYSTETLMATRETLHHLEEYKLTLVSKRKKTKSREELHYTDHSSGMAIRRTRTIIKKITEFADELPDHI